MERNALKPYARILALLAACGALAGCVRYQVREDNWFHPVQMPLPADALKRLALPESYVAEAVEVVAADGVTLRGLWATSAQARSTVFYFGGDSFLIARDGLEIAAAIAAHGANVFMLDYRGYGGSAGRPEIDALMADAQSGLAYLRRNGASHVVVHGMSMGSFVAAELAVRAPVDGLVLESTATSAREWAERQVPWYAKLFVRIDLPAALESQSNAHRLERYAGPLLLLAGGRDTKTPAAMARELLRDSASTCRELVEVATAGHGDTLRHAPAQAAYRRLLERSVDGGCAAASVQATAQRTRAGRGVP
jgi:pimeloyl-ACP methyl ester carboxylesterase